jgi:hypothetical protein
MEPEQCWQLFLYRDGHVILDSIKATQHQIEDADSIPQGVGQLLDDNREAAGGKNNIKESLWYNGDFGKLWRAPNLGWVVDKEALLQTLAGQRQQAHLLDTLFSTS